MKYFVYQGNDHDCGLACLKMLLAHVTRNKSYLYIPKKDKRESFTFFDLIEIGKEYGATLETYKVDNDYLNNFQKPFITIINFNHSVLVKKVLKRRVILYDPGVGRVVINREKFENIWSHLVLECTKLPTIVFKAKSPIKVMSKKSKLSQSFIMLLSSIILIISFYLLNDMKNSLFSLVFIGFFATFQMVENIINYYQISTFDKQFMPRYFANEKNCNKNGYVEYENFKRNYFTLNRSILTSIIIGFLVSFLLLFNDFKNGFVLIALVLIKTIDILIFENSEKTDANKVGELEEKFYKNPIENVSEIQRANRLANTLVFRYKSKQLISIVLSFAFAMLMMMVTGNSGCNYVIFHFGLYYIGSNSISTVLTGLSNIGELDKSEASFLDKCEL